MCDSSIIKTGLSLTKGVNGQFCPEPFIEALDVLQQRFSVYDYHNITCQKCEIYNLETCYYTIC